MKAAALDIPKEEFDRMLAEIRFKLGNDDQMLAVLESLGRELGWPIPAEHRHTILWRLSRLLL